jgi:hypothetical protein
MGMGAAQHGRVKHAGQDDIESKDRRSTDPLVSVDSWQRLADDRRFAPRLQILGGGRTLG